MLFPLVVQFFSWVSAETLPVFKNHGSCPESHYLSNDLCIEKDLKFDLKAESALTGSFLPVNGDYRETTAHYVRLKAEGTKTDGSKVLIPNAPVYFYPGERDQLIYLLDSASGELVSKKIPAYSRFTFTTNAAGVSSFFIDIQNDEQIQTQKMLVSAEFIPGNQMHFINADSGAFQALHKITAANIKAVANDLTNESTSALVDSIKLVSDHILQKNRELKPLSASGDDLELMMASSSDEKQLGEWEQLKKEVIKGVKLIWNSSKKILVAVVTTVKGVVELALQSVVVAFKVLVHFVKAVGVSLLRLASGIKTIMHWDDILNTQLHINRDLQIMHERIYSFIETRREEAVASLDRLTASIEDRLDAVIDTLRGQYPQQVAIADMVKKNPGALVVSDILDSNMPKASVELTEDQLKQLLQTLDELDKTVSPTNQQFALVVQNTRGSLKRAGADVLRGLLSGIRGMVDLIGSVASVSTNVGLVLVNTLNSLVWNVLTFEVKIPGLSWLFKKAISNGKYELSLMNLITFVPAMLYTYGYMLSHWGKAPFPELSSLTRRDRGDEVLASLILTTIMILFFAPLLTVLIMFAVYWLGPILFFILIFWLFALLV